MSHHVTTVFNQGMSFTATVNNYKVIMDGNQETGASPKRLMLAALAGCAGIDVVSILEKMKVAFSDFSIDTSAALTDEFPKIYKDVKVLYKIKLSVADRPKMEKAVRLSEDKYCGVHAMFNAFAKVETAIIYL
ncbi:MAG: OsmC family protein [Ferruginibacter sp.]